MPVPERKFNLVGYAIDPQEMAMMAIQRVCQHHVTLAAPGFRENNRECLGKILEITKALEQFTTATHTFTGLCGINLKDAYIRSEPGHWQNRGL